MIENRIVMKVVTIVMVNQGAVERAGGWKEGKMRCRVALQAYFA